MKYYNTIPEEQETLIHILYDEQLIDIYSSKIETIKELTSLLGNPTIKHMKSKTYWSGATWKIAFYEIDKIKNIVNKEIIIDSKVKIKKKSINVYNENFEQISII